MSERTVPFWTGLDILMIGMIAFLATCAFIPILIPIAARFGLVDMPNERKQHTGSVPLVGGIAIVLAVITGAIWSNVLFQPSVLLFVVLGVVLLLLGMWDDYRDISPKTRLALQILVGLALCFLADLQIEGVGDLIGSGYISFGVMGGALFTVMCSVGVFNSINMIDGIDGLAGSLVGVSGLALAGIAFSSGDNFSSGVLLSIVCAVLAFLAFNLEFFGSSRKVFLGDAGSLFLGFSLLWFFIYLSQSEGSPLSPVVAGWVFGLPLVDTVTVIVGRIVRGEHPLSAGRDHIHHRLLIRGFSSTQVLLILVLYHSGLVIMGVLLNQYPSAEPFLFWTFVLITVLHFTVLTKILPHGSVAA